MKRKRRRYASSIEEHSFNFSREPAMFEEDGSMIAWCFISLLLGGMAAGH
jgi:hypothetical protein